MDKELKAKWVKALRSGEWQQHRGGFYSRDGAYCCLGVLGCLLLGSRGTQMAMSAELWPEIKKQFSEEYAVLLARKNDGDESFAEIADYIEANL